MRNTVLRQQHLNFQAAGVKAVRFGDWRPNRGAGMQGIG